MSRVLNCIKVSHHDNYAWLVTTRDKFYGEVVAGKAFKAESQEYDLQVSWLVMDIVDENRVYLEQELKDTGSVKYFTDDKQNFEELDTYAQQLALENRVQQLIGRGAFGHKIFKNFRTRLLELIQKNDAIDRTFETVKIGMMTRYTKTPPVVISENRGYIPIEQVESGEFKVGLTDAEFDQLQKQLWFGENLVRNIYSFLLAEYVGKDYLDEQAKIAKTADIAAKEIQKLINDEPNEIMEVPTEPELLGARRSKKSTKQESDTDYSEQIDDEKKPVAML